jgi:hypothetical protein
MRPTGQPVHTGKPERPGDAPPAEGLARLQRLRLACILLSGGGLALAYALHDLWRWSWLPLALGLGWWFAQSRWRHAASMAMTGLFLCAAFGLWLDVAPLPMLLVTGFALAAWDLDAFQRRLRTTAPDPALQSLIRRHLQRLALVVVAGMGLAAVAMAITLRLDFWVVFGIALLLAVILSRAFLLLNRGTSTRPPE